MNTTNTDSTLLACTWSQTKPTQPGHYWYWDGEANNAPIPFPVVDARYIPQGWWADMPTPEVPGQSSKSLDVAQPAPTNLLPSPDMPGISTEQLGEAFIHVCHQQLTYDGAETNAWLVNGVLLTIQHVLFDEIRTYFAETTDVLVDGNAFSGRTMMHRLVYEHLISERCAAILYQRGENVDFGAVVRINPGMIWKDREQRPMAWFPHPINSVDLGVIENRANRGAKGRRSSLPDLMALLRNHSTPFSQGHSTPGIQVPHAVLATYPELAWPELSQAASPFHALTHYPTGIAGTFAQPTCAEPEKAP